MFVQGTSPALKG